MLNQVDYFMNLLFILQNQILIAFRVAHFCLFAIISFLFLQMQDKSKSMKERMQMQLVNALLHDTIMNKDTKGEQSDNLIESAAGYSLVYPKAPPSIQTYLVFQNLHSKPILHKMCPFKSSPSAWTTND